MKFVFKARDAKGEIREGMVEAASSKIAADILNRNGLLPVTIKEEKKVPAIVRDFLKVFEGVKQKELVILFQQLATLVSAHVPIISALRTIEKQSENRFLQFVLKEMANDIEDGAQFSVAIEKHPDVFSPIVINMLRAGEASGELQKSIEVVAEGIEKNYQLASKIRGALYYPAFVIAVAGIIAFLVLTFILPKITTVIKDLNAPVPWYTALLMSLGDFMNTWWWAVLLAIVAAIAGIFYYISTKDGKREWEEILLKIPVVGALARSIYVTRLAENLGSLLDGGIPVVRALTIVSGIVGNHVFEKIILSAAEEVRSGGTMSTAFLRSREIPPMVSQMILIGEETGSLSGVLGSIAKFYNQEVETTTKNLTTLIEPILIVCLGIGVGILTVGVLLPVYNIAGQL